MKMKTVIFGIIFAMVAITTQGFTVRPDYREPGRLGPPSLHGFPGYGPFNPKATFPKPIRFRRSPQDEVTVTGTVVQPLNGPERQPSVSVDYNHKIYEGQYGEISVTGGVAENPVHPPEATIGIQGSIPLGPPLGTSTKTVAKKSFLQLD